MKVLFILAAAFTFAVSFWAFTPQDSAPIVSAETAPHRIDDPLVIERAHSEPEPFEVSPVYVYGDRPVKVAPKAAAKRCVDYPLYNSGSETVVICSRD